MKLSPGQTIPAGYAIGINSWENDGDDRDSNCVYGLSTEEVLYFKKVLPMFKSECNNPGCFGNNDFDMNIVFDFQDMIDNGTISAEFALKFLGYKSDETLNDHEDCESTGNDSSTIISALQKFLGRPVGYDYDFIRVVEHFDVSYIAEEIKVPVLPEAERFYIRD